LPLILSDFNGLDHKIIYLIHLPILFFVSGYFSKIGENEPIKSFKRLFIPYIIFSIINKFFSMFILNNPAEGLFIYPRAALWFLISLFLMKMFLPIYNKFKYPILTAIIIAIFAGLLNIDGDLLGITRAISYMPIFLIGFYYKNNNSANIPYFSNLKSKKSYLTILIIFIIVSCIIINFIPFNTLLLKYPYKDKFILNIFLRLLIISLGIIFALLFNKIMTNKKCFLTTFGRNSMAIYVLHHYFTVEIKKIYVSTPFIINNTIISIIIVYGSAFVLAYILSRDFVTKYLNKFIDGIYNIFAKPD